MTNFQYVRDETFRYRSAKSGPVVDVEIYYRKDARVRGIYISVLKKEVELGESGGFDSESFSMTSMMDSPKVLLKALPRKSDKEILRLVTFFDKSAPLIASTFDGFGKEAALVEINNILDSMKNSVVQA